MYGFFSHGCWMLFVFLLHIAPTIFAQDLHISAVRLDRDRKPQILFPSDPGRYYILISGDIDDINHPLQIVRGKNGEGQLADISSDQSGFARFYRVVQLSINDPLDTDNDGIDDVYELEHPGFLNPLDSADAEKDFDGDGRSNREEYKNFEDPDKAAPADVGASPSQGTFLIRSVVVGGITKDSVGRTLDNIAAPPSVNDSGLVAFVGEVKYPDGSLRQNLYTIDPQSQTVRPLIRTDSALEWPKDGAAANAPFHPWQKFFGPLVNNSGTVLAVRQLQTKASLTTILPTAPFQTDMFPLLTYVEKWDGAVTSGKSLELVDSGDPVHVGALFWSQGVGLFVFNAPKLAGEVPSALPLLSGWGDGLRSRPPAFNNLGVAAYISRDSGQPYLASSYAREPFRARKIANNGRYPDMADDGTIVMAVDTGGQTPAMTVFNAQLTRSKVLDANYFYTIGDYPSISDDGNIVVFVGGLTISSGIQLGISPGMGIFAAIKKGTGDATDSNWEIVRVAGISGSGYLDPGETTTDLSPSAKADVGLIKQFDSTWTLGVGNQGVVTYLAQNIRGQKAIFTSRIRIDRQTAEKCDGVLEVSVDGPQQVTAVGASIEESSEKVADLALFDPIDNLAAPTLAYWARGTGGKTYILRATEMLRIRSEDRLVKATINTASIQSLYGVDARISVRMRGVTGNESYGPYTLPVGDIGGVGLAYAYDKPEDILSPTDPHAADLSQQLTFVNGDQPGDIDAVCLFNNAQVIAVQVLVTTPRGETTIIQDHTLVRQPQVAALLDSVDSHIANLDARSGALPPQEAFLNRELVQKFGASLFEGMRAKAAKYLGLIDGFWVGAKGDVESAVELAEALSRPVESLWSMIVLCSEFKPRCVDPGAIITNLSREILEGVNDRLEWAHLGGGSLVQAAYIEGFVSGYLAEVWVAGQVTAGVGEVIAKSFRLAKASQSLSSAFGKLSAARRGLNAAAYQMMRVVAKEKLAPLVRRFNSELGALSIGGIEVGEIIATKYGPLVTAEGQEFIANTAKTYATDLTVATYGRISRLIYELGNDATEEGIKGAAVLSGSLRVEHGDRLLELLLRYCTDYTISPGGVQIPVSVNKKQLNAVLALFGNASGAAFRLESGSLTRWVYKGELVYDAGSEHGHRILHALAHMVPDASKAVHTEFSVARETLFELHHEAWMGRGNVVDTAGGNWNYETTLPRVIGKNGSSTVRMAVKPKSKGFVTAFPK
jgi:hypothetical protein